MKITFSKFFELGDTEHEIKFQAEFGYNGIGSYQYWGQKCNDRGNLELEEITLIKNQNLPEHVEIYFEDILNDLFDSEHDDAKMIINAANEAIESQCEQPN